MSPKRSRWQTDWANGFPPASRPRQADGGIVARSSRGQIGQHWWSKRFIVVLETFSLGSRLTRGKNYARRGQVLSLSVEPGSVCASVQGSRRTPYKVTIGLAAFSERMWAGVETALAGQAILSARLLAGEMPADLEQVFTEAGLPLFPRRAADLRMNCSCPDSVVPCKHIAATFYLLAERFDDDPFQILHWRGRERFQLLDRLRELRRASPGEPDSANDGKPGTQDVGALSETGEAPGLVGAAAALVGLPVDNQERSTDPAAFWSGTPVPPLPVHPALPNDMLLRQLPAPGHLLGAEDLVNDLRSLYARLAEQE